MYNNVCSFPITVVRDKSSREIRKQYYGLYTAISPYGKGRTVPAITYNDIPATIKRARRFWIISIKYPIYASNDL